MITKAGGVPGFGSLIAIYAGQRVGIAVLCNREVTEHSETPAVDLVQSIDQALTTSLDSSRAR
jgi:hypothetical protein